MFNRIYTRKDCDTTLIVNPEGTKCIPLFYKEPGELKERHWDDRAFRNFIAMKVSEPLNDDALPYTSYKDGIEQGYLVEVPCPLM